MMETNSRITSFSRIFIVFSVMLISLNNLAAQSNLKTSQAIVLDAVLNKNVVELEWVNKSGQDFNFIEIERSVDGKNYKQIGLLLAGEENDNEIIYKFKDTLNSDLGNVIYYRLKSVENNGIVNLSEVKKINK